MHKWDVLKTQNEANQLLALAQQQLEEQKSIMLKELARVELVSVNDARRNRLDQAIRQVRLSLASVTEHPAKPGQYQTRIGYEMEDELVLFLQEDAKLLSAEKFPVLSQFMRGGAAVENKPTAVDPDAGRGKTKVKARGL